VDPSADRNPFAIRRLRSDRCFEQHRAFAKMTADAPDIADCDRDEQAGRGRSPVELRLVNAEPFEVDVEQGAQRAPREDLQETAARTTLHRFSRSPVRSGKPKLALTRLDVILRVLLKHHMLATPRARLHPRR